MLRKAMSVAGMICAAALFSVAMLAAAFFVTRAVASGVAEPASSAAVGAPAQPPVETPESPAAQPTPVPAATPEPVSADADHLVVRRILDTGGPIRFGDWFWDEEGAPAEGTLIITVDLTAQVLSVFRDGYEIGTAAIVYGADDKPTPLGTFPITQKSADHVSNLYNAPMPYMLRMTNDGISIHGSDVDPRYASHGCIGVPTEFAARLFEVAQLGDRVIVTDGHMIGMGHPIAER